jgi:ApbE superfamily uncharacterized protein (UPF0280 family)
VNFFGSMNHFGHMKIAIAILVDPTETGKQLSSTLKKRRHLSTVTAPPPKTCEVLTEEPYDARVVSQQVGVRWMANYIWLFSVAGGAAILGSVLAFGMINQNGKRSVVAVAGAFIVAGLALVWGLYVSAASTARQLASDPQASETSRPARQSDQNALPGLQQPNR